MVEHDIRARGVRDSRVLAAMTRVPREALVPPEMAEFAYEDTPLPIGGGQTISQPFIVAVMTEAVAIQPGDTVLEIGTGSGYAAAVLAELADHVYTIERQPELARTARRRLAELGYDNVEVHLGDGTLGWTDHAPYDAILVTAGGPDLPPALLDQLAVGGRLIIPVGSERAQDLVRITRRSQREYERENLGPVRFVPLVGEAGWSEPEPEAAELAEAVDLGAQPGEPGAATADAHDRAAAPGGVFPPRLVPAWPAGQRASSSQAVAHLVAECAERITSIDDAAVDALLDRIGGARVVLLGEATHGTSEFYRMRARITRELILKRGFNLVAVEADWPDAAEVNRFVRGEVHRERRWRPFNRFPTWMWRNAETHELIEWLRAYNREIGEPERQVSFAGLDLYSLFISAHEVIRYLERIDPPSADLARRRYGCLTPWQQDPALYGRAVLTGRFRSCEAGAVAMLRDLLGRRLDQMAEDGGDLFDATRNAQVVADAERYYRAMYYGAAESWNLRDQHMFDTLRALLEHRAPAARAVVWAHNSHVGDAAATEMVVRGEHNIGLLARARFGPGAYLIGFGTDRGTVAAAHAWDAPMEIMDVRPAHEGSYERICHDCGIPAFLLALRDPARADLGDELASPRLERAIGVVYRPDTETASHYFQAVLPRQFDEYIWFDQTRAITSLEGAGTRERQRAWLEPTA